MSEYTYLLLLGVTIIAPTLGLLSTRLGWRKKQKTVWKAIGIVAVPFIIWDIWATANNVWSFNPKYTTDLKILGLPIAEILFFLAVPYACLFVYEAVRFYWPLRQFIIPQWIWFGFSGALIIFGFSQLNLYTTVVSVILACVILLVRLKFSLLLQENWYWWHLLFCLGGFLIINTALSAWPIVEYNSKHIINLRIGTIPYEDFLYYWLMSTVYIVIYRLIQMKIDLKNLY